MISTLSLLLISGHMKFSTVKVPGVPRIQSVSIQMDRLGSQTLHCFLCSKNSQHFIWTHQSRPGLKTKRAWHYRNGASLDAMTLQPWEGWSWAIGQLGCHLECLLLLACLLALVWAFFNQIGPLLILDNSVTAGSINRGYFPAVCGHVS